MAKDNENSDPLKGKRKRSANWDALEKNILKSSIQKFVPIIENKSTDTNTNRSKSAAWHAVAKRFNELNYRKRHIGEIRQQWRTMKLYAKTKPSKNTGGPKPIVSSSPEPEDLNLLDISPLGFDSEFNVFDSESIVNEVGLCLDEEKPLTSITQEDVLPPINKHENVQENIIPLHMDTEFSEHHKVRVKCMMEEHDMKMKNMSEAQTFIKEEHNVKMKQMILDKEETQLRIEKLKLEILMLKSKFD